VVRAAPCGLRARGLAPVADRAAPAAPAAPTSATAQWDAVVEAAQREGALVIMGPTTADTREGLTRGFQQAYPRIQVQYQPGGGSELGAKILTERGAGQYLADVYIGGTTTINSALLPAGALDPIPPFLVGPAVQDPSPWLGGKFEFADNAAQHNLIFSSLVKTPMAYHQRLVSPSEIKSYRDLMDPKWKGKVTMLDPRTSGAGLGIASYLYILPSFGPEALTQLLNSGIVYSKNERQILDWVARGQYPLAIAPSERDALEMRGKGIEIGLLDAHDLDEKGYVTGGSGTLAVLNRAPHPNAIKVYLNWLLDRPAQTDVSKATGYPSRRQDVPTDHLPSQVLPKPGVQYLENYRESYALMQLEVELFLRTAIRD
jgi:iron(III) transport system substrate-binding protein